MTQYMPIKITRGEDAVFTGSAVDANGTAIDISTGSILFTVKDKLTDLDAAKVFQKSGSGLTSGGAFTIAISASDTSGLKLDSRYYDIELTLSGSKSTITRGKFILLPEVTRA